MPIGVNCGGRWLDVVCRKHPAGAKSKVFKNWYTVHLGDVRLGVAILNCTGSWDAICETDPQNNWMAKGYSCRHHAIEYMLRCSGYWPKD